MRTDAGKTLTAFNVGGGQELYLETLVQLVQAYEASRHAIKSVKGLSSLRHTWRPTA